MPKNYRSFGMGKIHNYQGFSPLAASKFPPAGVVAMAENLSTQEVVG